jgi:transcriptional regulator with XRE-family HTH domain
MATVVDAPSQTLRELRDARGLTPSDIERLTDGAIRRSALSQIEHGKVPNPTFQTVRALADVLGLDPQACYAAISATVAARAAGALSSRRPADPGVTLEAVLHQAKQLCAALEQLAAQGAR